MDKVGLSFVLMLGAVACTAQRVAIPALVAQAQSNEMLALADNRGHELELLGVVERTGIKSVPSTVINEDGWFSESHFSGSAVAQSTHTPYPYLYAHDPMRGEPAGKLLCFFEPDKLRQVARLRVGARVQVVGIFQQFSRDKTTAVLRNCDIR